MSVQQAILDPVPPHARHLFFDLSPLSHSQAALQKLAAACDGQSAVLGVGVAVAKTLGVPVAGMRGFPDLPHATSAIPATQHALWLWLRGDDPGDLLLLGHALQRLAAPAFVPSLVIDYFLHQDRRDLTGYEDGTENPTGERPPLELLW